MYLNTTVKIPVMKGKIITKKKGGATYILYQYGSEYNQDKKYAVPQRTIVGKMSSEDPTGGTSLCLQELLPEDRLLYHHPESHR